MTEQENSFKVIQTETNYKICSNGAINGLKDGRVTSTEFKLYILLLKYAFQKGNCYPSQLTLAKELRTTQPAVSMLLNSMEKADYIKKNTQYLNGVESLIYTLLV